MPRLLILFLLVLLVEPAIVVAQYPARQPYGRPAGGQGQERPSVRWKGEGELTGVKGKLLAVTTEDGNQWLALAPENKQAISLVGPAERSFLQRGMFVKFQATFDAKGVVQSAIDELTIITPREEDQFGVTPDGPPIGGEVLFGEQRTKVSTVRCAVVGRLTGISGDAIIVAAGRTPVRAELSAKAQVRVNVADLSLARQGDHVRLEGMHYPGREGQLYASMITITAKQPFGAVAQPKTQEDKNQAGKTE